MGTETHAGTGAQRVSPTPRGRDMKRSRNVGLQWHGGLVISIILVFNIVILPLRLKVDYVASPSSEIKPR